MTHTDGFPIVAISSRAEWRKWLTDNHANSKGVWLLSYKVATGKPTITYAEGVLEALCFGWIDSKPNKFDDQQSLLYYSPRNPRSNWSALNKTRVDQLLEQNLMTPAGQRMIDLAKEKGTWTALEGVDALVIPDDLQTALLANPPAEVNFLAFPKSIKQGILQWLLTAKRPETRAKRIADFVAKLARGESIL